MSSIKELSESDFWNIICFIVVSAANLGGEKKEYGPLRLLEVAARLIKVLRDHGLTSKRLDIVQKRIDENKYLVMTDESHFNQFLQSLTLEIVDLMTN
ncbi:MAG: DUF6092 family protein [Caldiserica bacterium]|jgi:hypothetical protein|nr:DUF6092 family protein [Caldisericota bacterium]